LPALSLAVTVKVRGPTVEVSSGVPFALLPAQVASPEPPSSSAQVKSANSDVPSR
jgi:hypothetical protein